MRTAGICIASKHNINIDAVVASILWQNIQFFLAPEMEVKQTKPLHGESEAKTSSRRIFGDGFEN